MKLFKFNMLLAVASLAASAATPAMAGLVYAARGDGTVTRADTATGVETVVADAGGHGAGGALGIAFDDDLNLYVSILSEGTIRKFTPDGDGTLFASGITQPGGLAFDAAQNLYVSTYGGNTVERITPAGTRSTFADGLSTPAGLAFDAAGNLFVANLGNNSVDRITPSGTRSTFAGTGLNLPTALAFDATGDLYVSSPGDDAIVKLAPDGRASIFADAEDGLSYPFGLAFDPEDGLLYVADVATDPSNIQRYTPDGVGSVFVSGEAEHAHFLAATPIPLPAPFAMGALGLATAGLATWRARRGLRVR